MKHAKKKTVAKRKTSSRQVEKLKKRKKYYVQVRVCKKFGSKVYYSKWSNKKSMRTMR